MWLLSHLLILTIVSLAHMYIWVCVRSMNFGTFAASRATCTACFVASTYCLLFHPRVTIRMSEYVCILTDATFGCCAPSARSLTTQATTMPTEHACEFYMKHKIRFGTTLLLCRDCENCRHTLLLVVFSLLASCRSHHLWALVIFHLLFWEFTSSVAP